MKNQENLQAIVTKLKEQGIDAGVKEKNRLITAANEKVEKMLAEAEAQSKMILEKAKTEAAQIKKNSEAAITQSARDMVEATKIALTKHLKKVFGKQCESLINQEEYLKELLKVVLETIEGNKTVKVSPALVQKMQSFIASMALTDGIEVQPLEKSEAKIAVKCNDDQDIQLVLTSQDIEDGLFSLLNQDIIDRIHNGKEE